MATFNPIWLAQRDHEDAVSDLHEFVTAMCETIDSTGPDSERPAWLRMAVKHTDAVLATMQRVDALVSQAGTGAVAPSGVPLSD
jgi:hypothetical protein